MDEETCRTPDQRDEQEAWAAILEFEPLDPGRKKKRKANKAKPKQSKPQTRYRRGHRTSRLRQASTTPPKQYNAEPYCEAAVPEGPELFHALLPAPASAQTTVKQGRCLQAVPCPPTTPSPNRTQLKPQIPEIGEDLCTPPSGLHPHFDVFGHADMTEYYLHTEAYYQFMTGTGTPAPRMWLHSARKPMRRTQPHSQKRGTRHRVRGLH